MTASVLKQNLNAKMFKRRLIDFNTDTQYAHFRGSPLYQATKRLSVVLWLDKGDFPEYLHTVCPS